MDGIGPRQRARDAVNAISRTVVTITHDGVATREKIFDQPPTIGRLAECVGPDVWVVSVAMKRRPRRARQTLTLYIE